MSCSIVDFTAISAALEPMQVCEMLSDLYDKFDTIIDVYPEVWKADVIGDSYMLVSNLSGQLKDHVDQVVDLGLKLQQVARQSSAPHGRPLTIRLGVHTGPAVTGVVGSTQSSSLMRFSVFGESIHPLSSHHACHAYYWPSPLR